MSPAARAAAVLSCALAFMASHFLVAVEAVVHYATEFHMRPVAVRDWHFETDLRADMDGSVLVAHEFI
jgi:hypothetical protein